MQTYGDPLEKHRAFLRITEQCTIIAQLIGGNPDEMLMTGQGVLLNPSQAARLIALAREGSSPPPRAEKQPDPPRAHQILELVSQGQDNKAIGDQLGVAEDTVKTYLSRLFKRWNARNRAHAVRLGFERGVLRPAARPSESQSHAV